jgi:hypothetical protein
MDLSILEQAIPGTETVIQFKYDLRARPHVIAVLKHDERREHGAKLNILDHMPRTLCCKILVAIFAFADNVFTNEFKLPATYAIQLHLGEWQSNHHIHIHVVMPCLPYYHWMQREQPVRAEQFRQRRPNYLKKTIRDHAKYLRADRQEARRARDTARHRALPAIEGVHLDLGTRTSTIDLHAAHDVTSAAGIDFLLSAVDTLRTALEIRDCFVVLHKKTGNHKASIMMHPAQFLEVAPPATRLAWYSAWSSVDDPVQLATGEDLATTPDADKDPQ